MRKTTHNPSLFISTVSRTIVMALPLLALLIIGTQATASATTRPKPGYMVVYSQQGRYNSVRVQATNAAYNVPDNTPRLKCGGSFSATADNHIYTRSLPVSRSGGMIVPRSLKCGAVDASNKYVVTYGKNNVFSGPSVSVDVDEDTCVYVRPEQQPVDGGPVVSGKCPNALSQDDAPSRVNATIQVEPVLSKNKRYITGTVKVIGSENLMRVQCAGTVTVTYASGKSSGPLNLRYVKNPSGNNYCKAKFNSNSLSSANKLTPGDYTVSADLSQTAYLNAANGSAQIPIPPRP